MFSMLVFMCRDPGETTSKCFKNSDFDATLKLPTENDFDPNMKIQSILKKVHFHRNYAFKQTSDSVTFTKRP